MRKPKNIFNLMKNDVISITGAGGKSSLMYVLGMEFENSLLTTSTKILNPTTDNVLINEIPQTIGTFVLGKRIENGKIIGYEEEELSKFIPQFDLTLIEADGSKEMNLKGWKESEPVVYAYSNKTIGVLDISVLDKKTEKTVFRLKEYEKITNAGTYINLQNLKDVVLYENGLFKDSNFKILYINKVENQDLRALAFTLVKMIKSDPRFDIDKIVIGSVKDNYFECIYDKLSLFILASGRSRRMKFDKLLSRYKDKLLIEHTLGKLSKYDFDKYIVCKDDRLFELSEKYNFKYILNNRSHLGLSESIKIGVKKVQSENLAFVLGDMPDLEEESYQKLLDNVDTEITCCKFEGEIIPPVLFSSKYKDYLLALTGDSGAKQIILDNLDKVLFVDITNDEAKDVDTEIDLEG